MLRIAGTLGGRAATPEQAAFIGNQAGGRVFLFLKTDDFDRDYAAYLARGVRFVREPATRAIAGIVPATARRVNLGGNKAPKSPSSRTSTAISGTWCSP